MVVYKEIQSTDIPFEQMDQFIARNLLLHAATKITKFCSFQSQPRRKCPLRESDKSVSTLERQRRCAIVGNSGILLNSRCGKVIDSYDFVVRAHLAPIRDYIIDVGHKTDVMLLNDMVLDKVLYALSKNVKTEDDLRLSEQLKYLNSTVLWYPRGATKLKEKLKNISMIFQNERIEARLGFSLQDLYRVIKWKYDHWQNPSPGLYMLAMAESLCKSISLFGFYPHETDEFGQKVPRNYYEKDLEHYHSWSHNFEEEYRMFISMRDKDILEMVKDPCN